MKLVRKNAIMVLLLMLWFALPAMAQEEQYGLTFKSYEVEKEKRTSLDLSPGKMLSLPKIYNLSFDLKFHEEGAYPFGYVFRIINEEGNHLNLLLNQTRNTEVLKVVFTYSSEEIVGFTFENTGIEYGGWFHVDVKIDLENSRFTATVNGHELSKEVPFSKSFNKVKMIFGRSTYEGLQSTDIPFFSLRNIRIQNKDRKMLYHWVLNKYNETGTFDEIKHAFASCENPDWIINRHVFWEQVASFKTKLKPQIAYNQKDNEIAFYDQSCFYRFSLATSEILKKEVRNDYPYDVHSNNMLYNPFSDTYIQYVFELEEAKDVLTYDTVNNKWNKMLPDHYPPDYWHHNRFISDVDSNLYLLGGYGHHKYKNNIIKYDFKTDTWEKSVLAGDNPHPHYLSGLGKVDERYLLLFGGYGSHSGSQELSPRFYYDLYQIDTKTLESKKIWTLEKPAKNFVVANTIVVDKEANVFYALAFPTHQFHTDMTLLKFSIDKPEYEVLGKSIPINFEDNRSLVDLFLDTTSNKLISVISSPNTLNDSLNTVSIYSLSYPPLAEKDLLPHEEAEQSAAIPIYIWIGLLLICLVCILLVLYRKQKNRKPVDTAKPVNEEPAIKAAGREVRKQSVCFFAGFCVIDKDGNDITKEFTPMLKQLFVLILLYTYKERKGISSTRLKDTLWFDKSEESAKNNRGVSITKLRQIFEQIGDIKIVSKNAYWTVELGDGIYCDYFRARGLIQKIKEDKDPALEDIRSLITIVSAGELLPNIQTEWVDPFKADFSSDLIDLLFNLSGHQKVISDPQLCIDLADAIFTHDSLNEDALRMKCSILVKMGRNGLAKNVYNSFTKEYALLFGSKFEYSFEQIININ